MPAAGTLECLLGARTTGLVGSHVDAVWYYSTYGTKLHHSDGPFGRLYACPDPSGNSTCNYQALLAKTGKDNLEIVIDFCREQG